VIHGNGVIAEDLISYAREYTNRSRIFQNAEFEDFDFRVNRSVVGWERVEPVAQQGTNLEKLAGKIQSTNANVLVVLKHEPVFEISS